MHQKQKPVIKRAPQYIETVTLIPGISILDDLSKLAYHGKPLSTDQHEKLRKIATQYVDRHAKDQSTGMIDKVYEVALANLKWGRTCMSSAMWHVCRGPRPAMQEATNDEN